MGVVDSDVEEQETTNNSSSTTASCSGKSHDYCGIKVNENSSTNITTDEKCEKNYQKVKEESTKKLVVLGSTSSSAPAVWSEKAENVQLKGINEENLAPPEPDSTTSTAAQQQQQFQTIEIAEFCSG